jgi:putative transposase
LREEFRASERRVCGLMGVPRSSCRYESRRDDGWLRERLLELAREHPRFGYRRLHVLLGREQVTVNHKNVQRVYRDLGLTVKRNRRKRLTRSLQPRAVLTAPGEQWSIDFASDVTASGRRLRVFSVIDSFTRQCHALEVDTSFPSRRVTRVLDKAIERCGKPQTIRCDNEPELCSRHFLAWAIGRKIDMLHIRPGKPTENAYVESFHGRLRDECLNTSWFWNLFDARRKISVWHHAYNFSRPHSALDYRTPNEFARKWLAVALAQPMDHAAEGLPDQASATLQPDRPFEPLSTPTKAETRL